MHYNDFIDNELKQEMITVHLDTFQSTPDSYTYKGVTRKLDRHTIEITIRGDRRRVACSDDGNGITLFGLAVKFRTGTKIWPGSAVYWHKGGEVNNLRPNIDKFNGQWCSLVGFFEDFANKKNRSQHNAVA